jgi:hypothetical protein
MSAESSLLQMLLREMPEGKHAYARGLQVLEAARQLLEFTGTEVSSVAGYSQSGILTDFLIEYLAIGKKTAAFLSIALPYLEDGLRGGEFDGQMKEVQAEITEVLGKAEAFKKANQGLWGLKEKLRNERQELLALQREKDGSIEQLINLCNDLGNDLETAWEELDARLFKEKERLKGRQVRINETAAKLKVALGELETVAKEEKAKYDVYERHFAANTAINARMQMVSGFSRQIQQLLKEYDKELKLLLEAEVELVGRVRQSNRPQ